MKNLPEELIYKIINYTDDLEKFKCHSCHKKISCIDDYISCDKFKFCCALCYMFIF